MEIFGSFRGFNGIDGDLGIKGDLSGCIAI